VLEGTACKLYRKIVFLNMTERPMIPGSGCGSPVQCTREGACLEKNRLIALFKRPDSLEELQNSLRFCVNAASERRRAEEIIKGSN